MILEGKYGKAKVYTELVEETAVEQIKELLNQPFAQELPCSSGGNHLKKLPHS